MCPHVVVRMHGVHLVTLLQVLVCPHVGGEGSGQGVVGQLFCPLGKHGVAQDREHGLEGKHGLHHSTEFSAYRGMLVMVVMAKNTLQ